MNPRRLATPAHPRTSTAPRAVVFILALAITGTVAGPLRAQGDSEPETGGAFGVPAINGSTVELRQRALLERTAKVNTGRRTAKESMPRLLAQIVLGMEPEKAFAEWARIARLTLEDGMKRTGKAPGGALGGGMEPFDKQALLEAYLICRTNRPVPEAIVKDTRAFMTLWSHKAWKGYGALNYRLMCDGSGFLAAETWDDLVDGDGLTSPQIRDATRERLLGYFKTMTHSNYHEYGAPTYAGVDFSAMKMIADFAVDPVVKRQATLALDWMLLNVACAWNQGYHVTPAGRSKYLGSTITSPDEMDATAAIGWLFFGGLRPVQGMSEHHSGWWAFPGGYRPPALFEEVARFRSKPFTHRGRFVEGENDVQITIFHTPDYSLTGQVDNFPNPASAYYKENRRQMLKWISEKPFSTFTPMVENANRPYKLEEKIPNAFGYGENPFYQTFQHEGTQVGIGKVPEGYPYWKMYVPFSKTGSILRRMETNGWILCHGGRVLFAFKSLKGGAWGVPPAKKPGQRDWPPELCDVYFSDARVNGWILETSPVISKGDGTDGELKRFAEEITTKTRVEDGGLGGESPTFTYRSLSGKTMSIQWRAHGGTFGAHHQVDGQSVVYDAYPLLDNPMVHQDMGGDRLKIKAGAKSLEYDFSNWTVTGAER